MKSSMQSRGYRVAIQQLHPSGTAFISEYNCLEFCLFRSPLQACVSELWLEVTEMQLYAQLPYLKATDVQSPQKVTDSRSLIHFHLSSESLKSISV